MRIFSIRKKTETLVELKQLSVEYNKIWISLCARLKAIKDPLNLTSEQSIEVDFGLIIPADESLQKHADMVNNDEILNELNDQLRYLMLKGCVAIFKLILEKGIQIQGYDLNELIRSPNENYDEIINLMQSLGGAQHIHFIDEKIALEIPARECVEQDRQIMTVLKYWLKNIKGAW